MSPPSCEGIDWGVLSGVVAVNRLGVNRLKVGHVGRRASFDVVSGLDINRYKIKVQSGMGEQCCILQQTAIETDGDVLSQKTEKTDLRPPDRSRGMKGKIYIKKEDEYRRLI